MVQLLANNMSSNGPIGGGGGFVGDPTSTSSLQTEFRQLLLRAWRERWTEITFGKRIKCVLPPGLSGDVFYLADCILREATSGPMPNSLFLSYLNQCLIAKIVSIGEVILAVTRLKDLKPQCIESLLEFINIFKHTISSNGNDNDCLVLSRSLVVYMRWLYQIVERSIKEIFVDGGHSMSSSSTSMVHSYGFTNPQDSKIVNPNEELYLSVIRRIAQSIRGISESPFLKSLLYLGRLDDPATWADWWKVFHDIQPKLMLLSDKFDNKQQPEEQKIFEENPLTVITSFIHSVEWIEHSIDAERFLSSTPIISVAFEQLISDKSYRPYRPLVYRSIRSAVSFAAILDLGTRPEVLANQLATIGRFFDLTRVQIYFETLHVTLVSLIDDAKTNTGCTNFNWALFLLFKLPATFQCLARLEDFKLRPHKLTKQPEVGGHRNELEVALDLTLAHTPMLDLFTLAYSVAPLQRLLKDFERLELVTSEQATRLLHSIERHASTLELKQQKTKTTNTAEVSRSSLSMVLRLDPQFIMMTLQSLGENNDSIEQSMQRRIGILCKMQKKLELYLSVIASNVMVPSFATQLETFLAQAQHGSPTETERSAQFRAMMFDVSFLYLVNIVQRHGLEAVGAGESASQKDSFFACWARWNLPQRHNRKAPEAILKSYGHELLASAEKLKARFIGGQDWETLGTEWAEVLVAAQLAIKEICLAWTADWIDEKTLVELIERFTGTMCSMALVAITWVLAQLQVVEDDTGKAKLMVVLEHLRTPASELTSGETSTATGGTTPTIGSGEAPMANFENVQDVLRLYHHERSQLMVAAVSRLVKRFMPLAVMMADKDADSTESAAAAATPPPSAQPNPSTTTLPIANLDKQLEALLSSKQVGSNMSCAKVHELHEMLQLGGVAWFTTRVVRHFFYQHEPPLPEAVDIAYGLFHLDLEQAALTLLRVVLPEFMLYKKHVTELTEPRVTGLMKLLVMTTFGALAQMNTFRRLGAPRRCAYRQSYHLDVNPKSEPLKMDRNLVDRTTFSFPVDIKMEHGDTSDDEAMEVDGQGMSKDNNAKGWLKSNDIVHEPILIELVKFLAMLDELISEFHPRLLVPQAWFEQCLLCLREDASRLLVFTPTTLFETMLHISLDVFTHERVLACFPLDVDADDARNRSIRKLAAKMLCVFDQLKKVTVGNISA